MPGLYFLVYIDFRCISNMSLHTLVILIILGLGSTCFSLQKATGRWKRVSLYGTRVWYYGAGKVLK